MNKKFQIIQEQILLEDEFNISNYLKKLWDLISGKIQKDIEHTSFKIKELQNKITLTPYVNRLENIKEWKDKLSDHQLRHQMAEESLNSATKSLQYTIIFGVGVTAAIIAYLVYRFKKDGKDEEETNQQLVQTVQQSKSLVSKLKDPEKKQHALERINKIESKFKK